jgi:hypothetical protein
MELDIQILKIGEEWVVGPLKIRFDKGLPTRRDVLAVFLYHHRTLRQSISVSCNKTASQIVTTWSDSGRTPTSKHNIVAKLRNIHQKYLSLKKHKNLVTSNQQSRTDEFCST